MASFTPLLLYAWGNSTELNPADCGACGLVGTSVIPNVWSMTKMIREENKLGSVF